MAAELSITRSAVLMPIPTSLRTTLRVFQRQHFGFLWIDIHANYRYLSARCIRWIINVRNKARVCLNTRGETTIYNIYLAGYLVKVREADFLCVTMPHSHEIRQLYLRYFATAASMAAASL